jgi:hypothetical protein
MTFVLQIVYTTKDKKFTKGFKSFWMLFFVIFVTFVVDKFKL